MEWSGVEYSDEYVFSVLTSERKTAVQQSSTVEYSDEYLFSV